MQKTQPSLFDARIRFLISMLYLFTLHWYRTKEENTLADRNKLKTADLALVPLSPATIQLVRLANRGFLWPSEVGLDHSGLTTKSPERLLSGRSGFTPIPYHVRSDDHCCGRWTSQRLHCCLPASPSGSIWNEERGRENECSWFYEAEVVPQGFS